MTGRKGLYNVADRRACATFLLQPTSPGITKLLRTHLDCGPPKLWLEKEKRVEKCVKCSCGVLTRCCISRGADTVSLRRVRGVFWELLAHQKPFHLTAMTSMWTLRCLLAQTCQIKIRTVRGLYPLPLHELETTSAEVSSFPAPCGGLGLSNRTEKS